MKSSENSSGWGVKFPDDTKKVFKKFSRKEQEKIYSKIGELQTLQNPFSHHQVLPLTAELKGNWKLKWGDFRVVFELNSRKKIIEVALVERKIKGTYRKLKRK